MSAALSFLLSANRISTDHSLRQVSAGQILQVLLSNPATRLKLFSGTNIGLHPTAWGEHPRWNVPMPVGQNRSSGQKHGTL